MIGFVKKLTIAWKIVKVIDEVREKQKEDEENYEKQYIEYYGETTKRLANER